MAKRTTKKKIAPPKKTTIASRRKQIDHIDALLIELINQRAKLSQQIGNAKRASETESAYDWQREEQVLRNVATANTGPLDDESVRAVFNEIISGARALQTKLKVAYLGPEYSYTHLASLNRFGQAAELVPVGSISAVFEAVQSGQMEFGLAPVENSTDGRIADTLDNFTRTDVQICGEVQMRIHHNLLGVCKRSEIKEVHSRPQAISQCRNWLAKQLPKARLVEVTSTSVAAQLAKEKRGVAAIASRASATHYALDVLAANIEDNPSNVTRFAVIGATSGDRTGDDKTALMFELEHRSGALADSIAIFKRQRVNLTWIESFPQTGPDGGYLFFVELLGHQQDLRVRRAIALLEKKVVRLVTLGSYARMDPID